MEQRTRNLRRSSVLLVTALVIGACGGSAPVATGPDSVAPAATAPESSTAVAPVATTPDSTSPVATEPKPALAETVESATEDATTEDASIAELVSVYTFDDPVVLIDPGAEPRQELRIRPAEGAETLRITQTQSMVQTVGGQLINPGREVIIDSVTAIDVSHQSDLFVVKSVVESMDVAEGSDPATAAQVQEALQAVVGIQTETVLNSRGLLGESTVSTSQLGEEFDELLGAASEISHPYPAEPVGVGAVWETSASIDLLGFMVEQVTRTTVVAIDGDRITLQVEAIQNVPAGTTSSGEDNIVVQEWETLATGTMTIDATQVVPIESKSSTETRQVLEIDGVILDQTMNMRVDISGGN